MLSSGLVILVAIIAASGVCVAVTFVWLANSLVRGVGSIRNLIEEVDHNVQGTVVSLRAAIDDINVITRRANAQMDRVEKIVENVEQVTIDARSSMHLVDETVYPALSNVKAALSGIRKGMEVWRETGTVRSSEQGDEPPR